MPSLENRTSCLIEMHHATSLMCQSQRSVESTCLAFSHCFNSNSTFLPSLSYPGFSEENLQLKLCLHQLLENQNSYPWGAVTCASRVSTRSIYPIQYWNWVFNDIDLPFAEPLPYMCLQPFFNQSTSISCGANKGVIFLNKWPNVTLN